MARCRRLSLGLFGLLFLACLAFSLLFYLSLRGYQRLSDETLIAEVRFQQLDQRLFRAYLRQRARCQADEYLIAGDQWRIDARFLKWKSWAVLLGLDARYRLERIEGRYSRLQDQRSLASSYYSLSDDALVDLVHLSEYFPPLQLLVDAGYGSSTYLPMDSQYRYRIYRTQSGIISRRQPIHDAARSSVPVIEIRHDCAGEDAISDGRGNPLR